MSIAPTRNGSLTNGAKTVQTIDVGSSWPEHYVPHTRLQTTSRYELVTKNHLFLCLKSVASSRTPETAAKTDAEGHTDPAKQDSTPANRMCASPPARLAPAATLAPAGTQVITKPNATCFIGSGQIIVANVAPTAPAGKEDAHASSSPRARQTETCRLSEHYYHRHTMY